MAHVPMLIGPPTLLCWGSVALQGWAIATAIIAVLMLATMPGTRWRSAAWIAFVVVWMGSGWISWASGI